MNGPLRIKPLPKAKPASQFTWRRGAAALPGTIFVLLMALILLVPAMRPGSDRPTIRFQRADVGYVPATRVLSDTGVIRIARAGERSVITPDPARLEQVVRGNCRPDRPLFATLFLKGRPKGKEGDTPCAALLADYAGGTFLKQDMLWASPTIWDLYRPGEKLDPNGDPVEPASPLKAIKTNARGLVESGYQARNNGFTLSYHDQPSGRCNWQLRRWNWLGQPDQTDSGIEAIGPDCPAADQEGLVTPGPATPCFDAAQIGVTIQCFDRFAVVSLPPTATGVAIQGQRAVPGGHYVLREGDVLSLDTGARVLQLLRRRGMSQLSPGGLRVRDLAYAAQTAQFDSEEPLVGLKSSIRYRWDLRLQRLLDTSMASAPDRDPYHTLRGTILIMDGMTGEIASTASYPHKQDQLAQDEKVDRSDWLKQNFAFEALAPGSTAKVPFAAAILGANPDLAGYTIPYAIVHRINYARFYEDATCPDGAKCIDLFEHENNSPPGDSLQGQAGVVGLERFITNSSNFYALSLVREAWRREPAQVAWKDRLRDLACGWPRSDPGFGDSIAGCPMRLWADPRNPERGRPASGMVVPSPANWIEPDNIFLGVLGNGNYNWTAVQLAQAYARVITGRAVRPRLLEHGEGAATLASSLQLGETSWRKIMVGMSGVITTGTASGAGLGKALPPGVFLYGKTGTPTLGWKVGGATQFGKAFVLSVVRTSNGLPPARQSDICAVKMVVVNIQLKTGGENRGAIVAGELLRDPAIGPWLTNACGKGAR